MVQSGLLACSQTFDAAACIVKIVECSVSSLMLIMVVYILIHRLCLDFRISFYLFISIFMGLTLAFIIVHAMDSDTHLFTFLAGYSYNVYFSIIVLKVGIKLINVIRCSINYQRTRKIIIGLFLSYQVILTGLLLFMLIKREQTCFALPFLLINLVSLLAALAFVVLGIIHSKKQEERIDLTLAHSKMRNPLPKFQCWIVCNFLGQIMVLVESIIFQINNCSFTQQSQLVDDICRLIFEFLSFHLGIAATIYFFHLSNRATYKSNIVKRQSIGEPPRAIELVYMDQPQGEDSMRKKIISM